MQTSKSLNVCAERAFRASIKNDVRLYCGTHTEKNISCASPFTAISGILFGITHITTGIDLVLYKFHKLYAIKPFQQRI
jgi:hypothetical protein